MKYTKDRKLYVNIIFFIVSLVGMFIIPALFYSILTKVFNNKTVCELLANLLFILFLYLLYFKDLNKEFKTYKEKFKFNFTLGFKYYFVGLFVMIISNLIIYLTIGNISCNESLVRDMLFSETLFTMFSIMIIAPLSEEIIFRKSLMPIIKNKWLYALACGLLFGLAHLTSCKMSWLGLVYIIPYGSLGFVFALMNHETKSTFTSITIHAVHNTITGLLLLVTYFSGAM